MKTQIIDCLSQISNKYDAIFCDIWGVIHNGREAFWPAIDASKEFVKVTNSNKLTPDNIKNIFDAYMSRQNIEHFAQLVPNSKISEEEYNLSVSTYVEQKDTREVVDIVKLNAQIEGIVAREDVLRREIALTIAEIEGQKHEQ